MFSLGGPTAHSTLPSANLKTKHAGIRSGRAQNVRSSTRATSQQPSPESLIHRFREGGEADASASMQDERAPVREEAAVPHFPPPDPDRITGAGLEFFDEADFLKMNDLPLRTARPVFEEGTVLAVEAEEYLKKAITKVHKANREYLLESGDYTKQELMDKEKEDKKACKKLFASVSNVMEATASMYPDPEEPRPENMTKVEELMYDWHIPGTIWFEEGEGGLPVAKLAHRNGEVLTIHLQGACITSWKRFDEKEALLVRPDAVFKEGQRINSGLTLAFPQYDTGILPFDGFAGNLMWEVVNSEVSPVWVDDPAPSITLRCTDTEETRKTYPHKFEFFYKITLCEKDDPATEEDPAAIRKALLDEHRALGLEVPEDLRDLPSGKEKDKEKGFQRRRGPKARDASVDEEDEDDMPNMPTQIKLQFTVKNLGDKDMEFLCATKPHFRVKDMCTFAEFVRVVGLGGKHHLDYMITKGRPRLRTLTEDYMYFGGGGLGVHSIYLDCQLDDILFCPGQHVHYEAINRIGFPDVLAIQPGDHGNKIRWSRFLAILGRGRLSNPIRLKPDKEWYGEVVYRFHDRYFDEPCFGYQDHVPPPNFPEDYRRMDDP